MNTTEKKPSKFQMVRDFFAANPDATTKDAVEAASKMGLDVAENYARQIRSKANAKSKKTKKRKQAKRDNAKRDRSKATSAGQQVSAARRSKTSPTATDEPVLEAVRFIRRLGGIQQARKAMASAESILQELNER